MLGVQRKGVVSSAWTIAIARRLGHQDVRADRWVLSFIAAGAVSLSVGAEVGAGGTPTLCEPPGCEDGVVSPRRQLCSCDS